MTRTLFRSALAFALLTSAAGCHHVEPRPPPPAEPPGTPDAAFRATQPKPSGELHFNPPRPESFKLKNGLTVYTVERHDLPLVAVNLLVKTGRDGDPASKQGLAGFTAAMLEEGAKGMDAPQIAASFEDLGITYRAEAGASSTVVGFDTLSSNLEQGLSIFSNVVLHPSFAEKDLERVRGQRQAALTASHDDPAAVAKDVLLRALYGEKHPWGAPALGTPAALEAIKKADLQRFHDTYYVPGNSALVVVGDVKAAELEPLLQKYLGAWKDKKVKPVKLPEPPAPSSPRPVLVVDKPGAPQSQIWVGQLVMPAKDPDRDAFVLLNDVFGGLFSSRVNLALREGKGWSYGVYSFPMWTRAQSAWAVAGGFVADKTSDSLGLLSTLLDELHQGKVTDAELAAAREAEIRSLAGNFEGNATTAMGLARLLALDLPIDDFSTQEQRYRAVTAADVQRVATSRIDPSKMTLVVVGPKDSQLDKLGALNVGKVELRDEAGKPLR